MSDDDITRKKMRAMTALEMGTEAPETLPAWQVDFTVTNEKLDYVLVGPGWGDKWLAVFLSEAAENYPILQATFTPYTHTMSGDGRRVILDKMIRIDFDRKKIETNLVNAEDAPLFTKVLTHFIQTIGNRAAAAAPVGQA